MQGVKRTRDDTVVIHVRHPRKLLECVDRHKIWLEPVDRLSEPLHRSFRCRFDVHMQRIGAPHPTVEQAYQVDQKIEDTDGLFDEITISVWADAERLAGSAGMS